MSKGRDFHALAPAVQAAAEASCALAMIADSKTRET
jgi:hypothetical protein